MHPAHELPGTSLEAAVITRPLGRRASRPAEQTAALSAATRATATGAPIPPSAEGPHAYIGRSVAVNGRPLRRHAAVAAASVPSVPVTASPAADVRPRERARGAHTPST